MTQFEFVQSVNLYSGELRLHALNFTKDLDDANDLLQDTLVKATRFAEKFDEGTNIKGWLFVIMRILLSTLIEKRNDTVTTLYK